MIYRVAKGAAPDNEADLHTTFQGAIHIVGDMYRKICFSIHVVWRVEPYDCHISAGPAVARAL